MAQPYLSRDDFARGLTADKVPVGVLRKQYVSEIRPRDAADTSRRRTFIISTGSVDRDNDTIAVSGWQLDNYLKNPTVLFAHDYSSLPIARAVEVGIQAGRLVATAEFAEHQMADTCLKLIDGGFLRATSVGFRPIKAAQNSEREGVDFLEQELLEFSIVPVPANPEALYMASAAGIDVAPIKAWADGVLKALAVHKVPPQARPPAETRADASTTQCPNDGVTLGADGVCPQCGWQSDPMTMDGPKGDPIRWNAQLSKAFDVDGEPLEASRLEYTWVSRFLETPVKDLFETTINVPSPRIGSFLTALEDSLAAYKTASTRNLTHGSKEVPPIYETIRLNSKQSRSFLVEGIRFLVGDMKMVVKVDPSWSGLAVTTYGANQASRAIVDFLTQTLARASQYKFLRGEAFALSGEFLTRGTETWDDLFLAPVNSEPLKRTATLLNAHGAEIEPRGLILGGPPGTGKTLAGRVLMSAVPDATFIWLSARDFYRSGVFGGMALAFDIAAENAPSVVFMEDVDDAFRDGSTIDLLKTELDGLKQRKGIVTIVTTNFPEQLPKALVDRPGRFHDVCILDLPTETIRRAMLAKWAPTARAATLDQLAKDTRTYSGAHIRDLVRFAGTIVEQDGLQIDEALLRALAKVQAQRALIADTRRPQLRTVKMFATVKTPQIAKGVSPKDVSTAKAPEGEAWSAPGLGDLLKTPWGEATDAQKRDVAGHFAWAAAMPPATFGDCKLPHHNAKGQVVWRGVAAAAARMGQARIPGADAGAVQAHLGRHYDAFGKTPPWKSDETAWQKVLDVAAGTTDEALATLLVAHGFAAEAEALDVPSEKSAHARGACSKCGEPCDPAVVICGPCAESLHPWSDAALLSRAAQFKRGRVLSAANEAKLQTAKNHLVELQTAANRLAECIDAVLAQLSEAPPPAAADDAATAAAVRAVDKAEVITIDADGHDAAFVVDDEAEHLIGVSVADVNRSLASALRAAFAETVDEQARATLNRMRGRVD